MCLWCRVTWLFSYIHPVAPPNYNPIDDGDELHRTKRRPRFPGDHRRALHGNGRRPGQCHLLESLRGFNDDVGVDYDRHAHAAHNQIAGFLLQCLQVIIAIVLADVRHVVSPLLCRRHFNRFQYPFRILCAERHRQFHYSPIPFVLFVFRESRAERNPVTTWKWSKKNGKMDDLCWITRIWSNRASRNWRITVRFNNNLPFLPPFFLAHITFVYSTWMPVTAIPCHLFPVVPIWHFFDSHTERNSINHILLLRQAWNWLAWWHSLPRSWPGLKSWFRSCRPTWR